MKNAIDLWPALSALPSTETVDANGYVRLVTVPQVIPFLPPAETANGTALVICPGGGYTLLDWTSHVERLAARFNPEGIAVIGVRYRTAPPTPNIPGDALEDFRRALRITIAHTEAWRIDPQRLVGLGYSAGSNLLLVHASMPDPLEDADALHAGKAALPYMTLMCLWPHRKPATDYPIRPDAPHAFLCASEGDDAAPVVFSREIAEALRAAGRKATLQVFPTGDHLAFNFREDGPEVDWTPAFLAWLREHGLR